MRRKIYDGPIGEVMDGPGAWLEGYLGGLIQARRMAPEALTRLIERTKQQIARDDQERERMSRR